MNLEPGNQIDFAQNEDDPKQWFLCKAESGLMNTWEAKGNHMAHSKQLVQKIMASANLSFGDKSSIQFLVGTEPEINLSGQQWFEIIIASAK